jgi:hypothetical protein
LSRLGLERWICARLHDSMVVTLPAGRIDALAE